MDGLREKTQDSRRSFYRPSEPQTQKATNQFTTPIVHCRTESPIPLAATTPSPSSTASSDSEVTNVTAKGNRSRAKSADWTEEETFDLLQA